MGGTNAYNFCSFLFRASITPGRVRYNDDSNGISHPAIRNASSVAGAMRRLTNRPSPMPSPIRHYAGAGIFQIYRMVVNRPLRVRVTHPRDCWRGQAPSSRLLKLVISTPSPQGFPWLIGISKKGRSRDCSLSLFRFCRHSLFHCRPLASASSHPTPEENSAITTASE